MEYSNGGELFEAIVTHGRLAEQKACKYFQELVSGIEYLHQCGICHRDLKPENLLLDYDDGLKLVDFGLSNTYEEGQTLKTACGSPCYAAPEMIAGKKYDGLKTDIWSIGIILFAMVCGYLPFEDPKTQELYKKILGAQYSIPKFVSNEARDLIKGILNTNPDKRFTIADIRASAWFKQVKDQKGLRAMGLFPGKEKMPVNEELFSHVVERYQKHEQF